MTHKRRRGPPRAVKVEEFLGTIRLPRKKRVIVTLKPLRREIAERDEPRVLALVS